MICKLTVHLISKSVRLMYGFSHNLPREVIAISTQHTITFNPRAFPIMNHPWAFPRQSRDFSQRHLCIFGEKASWFFPSGHITLSFLQSIVTRKWMDLHRNSMTFAKKTFLHCVRNRVTSNFHQVIDLCVIHLKFYIKPQQAMRYMLQWCNYGQLILFTNKISKC